MPYVKKITNGLIKKIKIGPFYLPYYKSKRWNRTLPFLPGVKELESGIDEQKLKNYRIREELNDERKVQIISEIYERTLQKKPDLVNPVSLTEKTNWMKLHYHNPEVAVCCDKYKAKAYVEKVLGRDICVPLLKSWENSEDVSFDELPESFALKVNWSSGYNIFVQNKSLLSPREVRLIKKQLEIWMRPYSNSYYHSFNWGYKDIKPMILAEEMLDESYTEYEYKVFCFNGVPDFTLVEVHPNGPHPERVCVDREGERLPFCFGDIKIADDYRIFDCYKEILDVSQKLAGDFPLVRIDFMVREQDYYLGEMTFYSGGGFSKIHPEGWDEELGKRIQLA